MTRAATLACLAGFALPALAQACTIVQQTPDAPWTSQGEPATVDFPSNVTATNSVICIITGYRGDGYQFTSVRDENDANTLSIVNDSSSGDADSGTAAPFTRVVILAVHNVGGTAFNGMEVNGHGAGVYGAWKCYEMSGLAASPNDRACSVQDVQPQAADANCAIGTLAQAQEFVVAGMAITESDSNLNITGPTGGPTWTNDDIFQDAASRLGYSIDRGITSVNTAFTVQYSHDDLAGAGNDHTIAAATFKCAATGSYWQQRRRTARLEDGGDWRYSRRVRRDLRKSGWRTAGEF